MGHLVPFFYGIESQDLNEIEMKNTSSIQRIFVIE